MTIDWAHFTPWASLIGGVVLGIAAAIFIVANGRMLGISGIVGGLLKPRAGDITWRVAFVLGLLCAPWLFELLFPVEFMPTPTIDAGYGVIAVAGLLVGVGTRYGSGCTSGHGVCGVSRLSLRSITATATFMAAGFLVVYVARHLL